MVIQNLIVQSDVSTHYDIKTIRWYHTWPIFNIVYDIFADSPSPAQMQVIMNLYALLGALVLGVVATVPKIVSFDALDQAKKRFDGLDAEGEYKQEYQGYKDWCNSYDIDGTYIARQLIKNYIITVICLCSALIATMLTYMALMATNFKDNKNNLSFEMLNSWWVWARVPIIFIFVMLQVGGTTFGFTSYWVMLVSFPDYWIESKGASSSPGFGSDQSPYGLWVDTGNIMLVGVAWGGVLLCLSLALMSKNKVYMAVKERNEKEGSEEETKKAIEDAQRCFGMCVGGKTTEKPADEAKESGNVN
jgi:hypothetical protein